MKQSNMDSVCRWESLLIGCWTLISLWSGIYCNDGAVNHLSREDVLLFEDKEDLKCFTRKGGDLTCFFKTADNKTYDFLYLNQQNDRKTCNLSVQRTEEGTFLHICSFPSSMVLLFVPMQVNVVERDTNTSLYNQEIHVEENFLMDPPSNVSLRHNDEVGKLRVSWCRNIPSMCLYSKYRIQYWSKGLGEKTKEGKDDETETKVLESLVPGDVTQAQVSVKCGSSMEESDSIGHWSHWSQPAAATVAERADNISLTCFTSDLQNITCQFRGNRDDEQKHHTIFYKSCSSVNWTECATNRCRFRGDKCSKVKVIEGEDVTSSLSRTFLTPELNINSIVKTSPPGRIEASLDKDRMCLRWDAPLLPVSADLQYEVTYQRDGDAWMIVTVHNPHNHTCLEVSAGTKYNVKVRVRLIGNVYSGFWSDWSDQVKVQTPTDNTLWLLRCLPILLPLLIITFTCRSKLKHYFWPPVPNPDKVIKDFLTDINKHRLDPPLTSKQCCEETTSSAVEIMSEAEVSASGRPLEESTLLMSPEGSCSSSEQVNSSPDSDIFPDYVTLKHSVVICPKGNRYFHDSVGDEGLEDEFLQTCDCSCSDSGSDCVLSCSDKDFLNHSYVPPIKTSDTFTCSVTPGNFYTNMPCN